MANATLDPEQFYLVRGSQSIEKDEVDYRNLMTHYKLEPQLAKMADATLPSTYHHLLRGVGEARDSLTPGEAKGDLLALLEGVPFDRPIEPLPESVVKSALQLPAGSKSGPVLHPLSSRKTAGLIHAPPPTGAERAAHAEKQKGKAKDDKDRKEKKEKKKKKREREDATTLQKLLAPLVTELRGLTWAGWVVSGKPGNPFLQKFTKENCKRLGVPNYFDYIKNPMDLTRMKEKVERAEYSKIDQFTSDIKLMASNAKTFNRVGEPVHQMAIEIEQLYESKLPTYKKMFDDLQQERKKRKKEKKKRKEKKKEK
ncbi:Transcription initiation factor TFIID [Phytophthora cinnamomi]|uniref:Transcription initiation factor TFIID n=1 Tax=Phytophthora cinnamomi TaxID=4785 RepID=UPI003559A096|nr:Transcription initiation factor TFIID [Phytophthora cinnamomi]